MSASRILITVNQALLLLISKERDNAAREQLKKLFFTGADTKENQEKILLTLNNPLLANYTVTFDAEDINEDPVRRYFETHLAENTLEQVIPNIKRSNLLKHLSRETALIPIVFKKDKEEIHQKIGSVFYSNIPLSTDPIDVEYASEIRKLRSRHYFTHMTLADKEKITLLLKCLYICAINIPTYNILPIDIYTQGFFKAENRGRILKDTQELARSQNAGLLKSYMPVSQDDSAYLEKPYAYQKPADRCDPRFESAWAQQLFSKWVHPFSCSISGTMLIVLRYAKYLAERNQFVFTEHQAFTDFIKATITALLVRAGGHSFYEFHYPMTLPEVKEAFQFIPGFDKLTLEHMFLDTNQEAFEKALIVTLDYNQQILQRKSMHVELVRKVGMFATSTTSAPAEYPLSRVFRQR